jgi:acyl-coenzyme A thioesterase 13
MRSDFPHIQQNNLSHKAWVDPVSLPNHGDISGIGGNAADSIKQLNMNTYMSYGVGNEDTFGYKVGKAVKFVDIAIERKEERKGRLEATTVAELIVTKGAWRTNLI